MNYVSIDEKRLYKFSQFNINEFYPCIKKPLQGKNYEICRKVY